MSSTSKPNTMRLSAVDYALLGNDISETDVRNRTHPWGVNPIVYLEEIRQQLRLNKLLTLRRSISTHPQVPSSPSGQDQHQTILPITDIFDHLHQIENKLTHISDEDLQTSTSLGKEVIMIITDLLLRVVHQIGQSNIRTPTFESIIAYLRNLMHTRSAHMRQSIPGLLLISWYEVSSLLTSIQNQTELRMTKIKVQELLNIAHDTCAWAYKHLADEARDGGENTTNP